MQRAIILAAICLFIITGLALIPYAGIEADEALFTTPLYRPAAREFRLNVFHQDIVLMVMSYIGTLKTLLYWPILRIFSPGPYTLRLPMVLAGALTILLFRLLARDMAGERAALVAAVLLATDPTFILSETFDWGPVALEHLLLVGGCWLMARRSTAAGCFCFGLALWNKATFAWALAGLAAGALAAYGPEVRALLRDRRQVARAGGAFLLGALPFVIYNVHAPNATARSNVHLSLASLPAKVRQLEHAADGSGLSQFLVAEDWDGNPKPARSLAGWPRRSLFPYAIVLALAAVPLWWRTPGRRAATFAIVFCAVTFLAMAVTRDAGAAIHHSVLLWPLPHLLAGIGIAALRPRWLAPAIAMVLIASNLLVTGRYIGQFERNGAFGKFTDAIYPLADYLAAQGDRTIYVIDWGIDYPLDFLLAGRLKIRQSYGYMTAPGEVERIRADREGLIVTHVAAQEVLPGMRGRVGEGAPVRTIADSNGRPVFEILRAAPQCQ